MSLICNSQFIMNNAEFFDDESGLNDISGRVKNDERGQSDFSRFVMMTIAVQAVFLDSL